MAAEDSLGSSDGLRATWVNEGIVRRVLRSLGRVSVVAIVAYSLAGAADLRAETLSSALANAYMNNPDLNAQRAAQRARDEEVPKALSGFRPKVSAQGSLGSIETRARPGGRVTRDPGSIGLTITQPVYSGMRNVNATKAAEAGVLGGRLALDNAEQNTLLSAVEAYMNVVRDNAIVRLRKQNVDVLTEQLRATRDRFDVGELTRTDVAQGEARAAGARSAVNAAAAQLLASRAVYKQIVGRDPTDLSAASPRGGLPRSLSEALSIGLKQHPAIQAAEYLEESAAYSVKVAEGALLPTLSIQASAEHSHQPSSTVHQADTVSILGVLTIPIYQGGGEYANVRQAKHERSQAALEIDVARQSVEAAILAAWGGLEAATAQLNSADAQIRAADIALSGVREEASVGQRTTLDVLNAQQELLDARVSRIVAQRDQVVASYALTSAIGRLSAQQLSLAVQVYEPEVNYEKVRDRWFGLRTPDGQ
ncbi:MAG: TolC family outer membrane protein [Rhodobiaceae bacterium]|nr:TolC family outer membrane protein [Rhodobiaceae bacterium]MCC0057066.1 TolC family outer membrane protein [Rhodobiaceae bacterium]